MPYPLTLVPNYTSKECTYFQPTTEAGAYKKNIQYRASDIDLTFHLMLTKHRGSSEVCYVAFQGHPLHAQGIQHLVNN